MCIRDSYYINIQSKKTAGRFNGKIISQLTSPLKTRVGDLLFLGSGEDNNLDFYSDKKTVEKNLKIYNPSYKTKVINFGFGLTTNRGVTIGTPQDYYALSLWEGNTKKCDITSSQTGCKLTLTAGETKEVKLNVTAKHTPWPTTDETEQLSLVAGICFDGGTLCDPNNFFHPYNYHTRLLFNSNLHSGNAPITTTKTCTDTDGGINQYVRGTVSGTTSDGENFASTDRCGYEGDPNKLKEFYCDAKDPKNVTFTCAHGCLNGACVLNAGDDCGDEGECTYNGTRLLKCSIQLGSQNLKWQLATCSECASACPTGTSCVNIDGEATCRVPEAVLQSIELQPDEAKINVGLEREFTVTAHYSDDTIEDVTSLATCESSNGDVEKVSGTTCTFKASNQVQVPEQGITTTITASYTEDSTTKTDTSQLTILPEGSHECSHIILKPHETTIRIGDTQAYSSILVYSDNSEEDVTTSTDFISLNSVVASMGQGTNKNIATCIAVGDAEIQGSYGTTTCGPFKDKSILHVVSITPPPPPENCIIDSQTIPKGNCYYNETDGNILLCNSELQLVDATDCSDCGNNPCPEGYACMDDGKPYCGELPEDEYCRDKLPGTIGCWDGGLSCSSFIYELGCSGYEIPGNCIKDTCLAGNENCYWDSNDNICVNQSADGTYTRIEISPCDENGQATKTTWRKVGEGAYNLVFQETIQCPKEPTKIPFFTFVNVILVVSVLALIYTIFYFRNQKLEKLKLKNLEKNKNLKGD